MKLHGKIFCLAGVFACLCLFGCSSGNQKLKAAINRNASPDGELAGNPMQGKVFSSWINASESTMSTLFGNYIAVAYARTHSQHEYRNGSVLSLVTWKQQDDNRWFGAKIPDQVKSVEFIFVTAKDSHTSYSYQKFEGAPLKRVSSQEGPALNEPATYMLSQRAAVMP